jgi:hypothetical protein
MEKLPLAAKKAYRWISNVDQTSFSSCGEGGVNREPSIF